MPIGKEQFLKQFTQQALDERISLFIASYIVQILDSVQEVT